MKPTARCFAFVAALVAFDVSGLTITGQVTSGGTPLAEVVVMGPKATCSRTNAAGNYSCTVPTGWTGTLAAYADGYAMVPATWERAGLATSQSGVNFSGVAAAGLRPDVALFRTSPSRFLVDTNGDAVPDMTLYLGGAAGDVPLAGDLDGNGVADLVIYRNGLWYVDTNFDGIADRTFGFGGAPGDVPLVGDIDGDGTDDLVIYRNGIWYVSTQRNGVVDHVYYFGGAPGDIPLLGDFDGDGVLDLAIYRSGIWYISTARDGIADIVVYFGAPGDVPVVLDYNADGKSDLALFRGGLWYVNTQLDGTVRAFFGYGAAGDRPLAGHFNRANTLFVRAGSACTTSCTTANPYGTITGAWQDAVDGATIRVAAGVYPENLAFSYPGNQYAPGKFGKNNIKLVGVSRTNVVVAPPSGDALVLQGAAGYFVQGMRFTSSVPTGRGIVTVGGPGSVIPSFPGPQLSLLQVDALESGGTNVLLTGTSNTRIRNTRINRSHGGHGMSAWHFSYARVLDSEVIQNGYATPTGPPPPDAGKGLDVRDDSELDARRNTISGNLTFGVIGVNRSVVRLTSNTVATSGYNGIIICGALDNDQTASYVTGNYIAGNGTVRPDLGWNGMEIFLTCSGSHQVSGNTFVGNTLNGLFVGSGTTSLTGNTFTNNRIGVTAFAGTDTTTVSSTNTTISMFGNTFDANQVDGLYAARSLGTPRTLVATVGGLAAGQANTFRNHVAPAFHALSCENLTTAFVCPSGGNAFSNNVDDVESLCPSSCKK